MKQLLRPVAILLTLAMLLSLSVLSASAASDSNAIQTVSLTVDGETISTTMGTPVDLTPETEGEVFVYASVTDAAGATTYLTEPTLTAADGLQVTTHSICLVSAEAPEIRLGTPEGIRFTTELELASLEGLKADANVISLKLGTLIAPSDYLGSGVSLTKHSLTAAGKDYLEIPVTDGCWYAASATGKAVFAGSILRIQEENRNRAFSGVGYLAVTLKNGTEVTVYAADRNPASGSIARLAHEMLRGGIEGQNDAVVDLLTRYAAFWNGATREAMAEDLYHLNVMAIGDSLFCGNALGTQGHWFHLLAEECKWMLSNYGMNGWTMAYNPGAYPANATVRTSIYRKLYGGNYYVFGRNVGTVTYNYSDHTSATDADVDLIFLEGGINDADWGIPCGDVTSTDPSCCMGAYNRVIKKLLADFPKAKIVLVTTWQYSGSPSRNTEGLTYKQYTGRLAELYNTLYQDNARVLLLDAGNPEVSGVDMDNASFLSTYAIDKNHLNAAGMAYMKEQMLEPIWQLLFGK